MKHVKNNYAVLEFRLQWRDDLPQALRRCESCHNSGLGQLDYCKWYQFPVTGIFYKNFSFTQDRPFKGVGDLMIHVQHQHSPCIARTMADLLVEHLHAELLSPTETLRQN